MGIREGSLFFVSSVAVRGGNSCESWTSLSELFSWYSVLSEMV